MTTWGTQVRTAREAKGMSREDLADALACHLSTIYRWENDEVVPKDVRKIAAVAAALGVDREGLIGASVAS